MLERQREEIARAKAEGLYRSRKPTAQRHKDAVIALHKPGMGVAAILEEIRSMEDRTATGTRSGRPRSTRSSQITGSRLKWRRSTKDRPIQIVRRNHRDFTGSLDL